ncbi:MAG: DUF1952 domain-containing protein [Candidatus Promineifilaceae bacterium]|nr:DUF1952 domain-containing protein [Candidatus Promineifilaceae bacterium]
MVTFSRDVCGIPLWLLREYLEEAGGQAQGDDRVAGDGWTATLTQIEDYEIGSVSVGQVRVEVEGQPDAMERMTAFLEKKLLRAGG